jgi:predicted ATPase
LAGDFDAAERYGAMLLDHTERHPMRLWQLWVRCFNGMVMGKRGDIIAGLDVLRGALEQAGDAKFLPRFLLPLGELAACLGEAGEVAQAFAIVDDALARCKTRDEGWYLAELLRIRGELILKGDGSQAAAKAEEQFLSALDSAHRQGALSWELRAATSLARLLGNQGRSADATALLQPVYGRFTEGFATADLKAAKALLGGGVTLTLVGRSGTRVDQVYAAAMAVLPLCRRFGSEGPQRGPRDEVSLQIKCPNMEMDFRG